jgi:hypothetical protein
MHLLRRAGSDARARVAGLDSARAGWDGEALPRHGVIGPEGVERSWHGLNAAITVKYVCDSNCNNTWMADLEHRAKPYLLAMMRGLSITLDTAAQTLVAAWALKTAMVFECTNPTKNWFFLDEERRSLRVTRVPGLGLLIWLGRSSQTGWSFGMANRLSHSEPDTSVFSEGYVNTFAMNHLVIQLLTLRRKPEFQSVGRVRFSGNPGPWTDGMVQIWPAVNRSRVLAASQNGGTHRIGP